MTKPIWVPGTPEPKGSMTRIPARTPGGKACWINDNPRYPDWEDTMVQTLALQAGNRRRQPLNDALELRTEFYLPKPPTTGFKHAPIGEGIGDLDKLVRGLGDAGKKARLYTDDSRITRIVAEKLWATGRPGVRVEILPYTPPPEIPHGPMEVRVQVGRTNNLVGSVADAASLPGLLRQVADRLERATRAH